MQEHPPVAPREPVTVETHGDRRVDEYAWMRNLKDDPRVKAYLEAENAWTQKQSAHTQALQAALYKEMIGHIKETDLSVPDQFGAYHYYHRMEEGKAYAIHCRKRGPLDAPEEILLDENALAQGHSFLSVGALSISPDHRLLAWTMDTAGNEMYTLRVKNLESGKVLADEIVGMDAGIEWANDNRTLFYVTRDAAWRPFKVWRHVLGSAQEQDTEVYVEHDEYYWVGLSRARSGAYLFIDIASKVTSEVRYLSADQPTGEFQVFAPRQHKVEYSVQHQGERFFILTNEHAQDFKLMSTPVGAIQKDQWQERIAHRPGVTLSDLQAFDGFLAIVQRRDGIRRLRILEANGKDHEVAFPEEAYDLFVQANREYRRSSLRIWYTSLVTPARYYDYHVADRRLELRKETEVPGYDRSLYESMRLDAPTVDGKRVPLYLVYRKGLALNGKNPVYLEGYGAYGIPLDPFFSIARLSLLDRGFVYALAAPRGGAELGRAWYEDGKMLNKKHSFGDFIACAEHLIDQHYTSAAQLAISGASAGGLLVGATINLRPDLFRVAVLGVPFLDVLNTILDEKLPLTVVEWEEWGNPATSKEYYDYIKSYSPYENIGAQAYPAIFVYTSLNDIRVNYWEPAKFVARLREKNTGKRPVLLKIDMNAGHAGASGRYDRYRDDATEFAFVLDQMGRAGTGTLTSRE